MKKFLYNHNRTKIFNLDMVVSIEKVPNHEKIIILTFANGTEFAIIESDSFDIHLKFLNVFSQYPFVRFGHYEINQKLFQYFNHKFTHSALCQKQKENSNNE